MKHQPLPPEELEITMRARAIFKAEYGSVTAVARFLKADDSRVSRMLNPLEGDSFSIYEAAHFLDACYRWNVEFGNLIYSILSDQNREWSEGAAAETGKASHGMAILKDAVEVAEKLGEADVSKMSDDELCVLEDVLRRLESKVQVARSGVILARRRKSFGGEREFRAL